MKSGTDWICIQSGKKWTAVQCSAVQCSAVPDTDLLPRGRKGLESVSTEESELLITGLISSAFRSRFRRSRDLAGINGKWFLVNEGRKVGGNIQLCWHGKEKGRKLLVLLMWEGYCKE